MLNIGIDGDIYKSGVATKDLTTGAITLQSLRFFDLYRYLQDNKEQINIVRVEAGYLNAKANFHYKKSNTSIAAKIGSYTGANGEVCKKIVEMCQDLGLPYQEIRPLKKRWKGKDGKITHEEMHFHFPQTKHYKRSNQEMRDAFLLIA